MAKLYFRYGAMGSSKTANAIMVQYNYQERGQSALMIKPRMDSRDGARIVASRSGLSTQCIYMEEIDSVNLRDYNCIIVDEAQFLSKEQVWRLVEIVDDMNIPVICYGLRADFKGNLFTGSQWLMAWADTIEEIKTVCWCGKKAITNARVIDGKVAREGEQIVLGGNESYVALCRKHWRSGELAPLEVRRISAEKKAYLYLLLKADPSEIMIDKYLDEGDMYVLLVNGQPAAEAVVRAEGDQCELCNLATAEAYRGNGYASKLIEHLKRLYRVRCKTMIVGTAKDLIPFYEKFGFRYSHTIPDFFANGIYDPKLFDEGEDLRDMEVLQIEL